MARGEPDGLRLKEDDAQAVILVRAVEEVDRGGLLLPFEARRQASRDAAGEAAKRKGKGKGQGKGAETDEGPDDDPLWWSRRAHVLLGQLVGSAPYLPRLLAWSRPARSWLWPLVLVSLVIGLGTQALGPRHRVSLLALPLFALLAWNVVSLLLLVLRGLLPLGKLGGGLVERVRHWWGERLQAQVARLARRPSAPRRQGVEGGSGHHELLARALGRYLELWLPTATPLALSRLRRLLHGAAWMMVAGAVAGMYLRGLVWEYRVTWESTFLGPRTLDAFLGTLLAPAAAVLGSEVPSVAELRAPASGDAAPWIHLWAMTAVLVVGVPRGLAWLAEHWRVRRLSRRLPVTLGESYRRRLRSARDLVSHRLEVVPYSHQPSQASFATLEGLLHDLVGLRSEIRRRPPVPYGEAPPALFEGRLRVLLFNLAQTPELEVHGEWLAALENELIEGQALLVLVDAGPYRRRLGDGDPRRLAERERAWQRVVASVGVEALVLDLEAEPEPDLLVRLAATVWPAGALEG